MIKHWTDLEDEIEKILSGIQVHRSLAYIRLYDTKSAGDLIPSQPADFLVTFNGVTTLLEAKFSAVHDSLYQCFSGAVSPNQTASAHIWTRAKARYFFLFYSLSASRVELWEGAYCSKCRASGSRLEKHRRDMFDSLSLAVQRAVGIP